MMYALRSTVVRERDVGADDRVFAPLGEARVARDHHPGIDPGADAQRPPVLLCPAPLHDRDEPHDVDRRAQRVIFLIRVFERHAEDADHAVFQEVV
jgi:hypothetical protein